MSYAIKVEFNKRFQIGFLLIFSAMLLATLTDQSLNKQIDVLIRSPQGLSNIIWAWGAVSLVSALFFPLLVSLLCSQALTGNVVSIGRLFSEKFELGLIETLRAWGQTFLWCFVFIIPGLIKFTYYLMAPFVVFFSKKYAAGEVDALKYSTFLSKKFWWRLNLWLLVFYFMIPILTSVLFDEYKLFSMHPVSAFLCVLLDSCLVLAFHYFILQLFLRYLNEVENGSSV